jgi:hypothetical protein
MRIALDAFRLVGVFFPLVFMMMFLEVTEGDAVDTVDDRKVGGDLANLRDEGALEIGAREDPACGAG